MADTNYPMPGRSEFSAGEEKAMRQEADEGMKQQDATRQRFNDEVNEAARSGPFTRPNRNPTTDLPGPFTDPKRDAID